MNEQGHDKALPTIDEVYKLAKENNQMLKRMRRDAFVGGIVKFVWWVFVFFVLPYILFVMYLQPYLMQLQTTYANLNESAQQVNQIKAQFPNLDLNALLKQFSGGGK